MRGMAEHIATRILEHSSASRDREDGDASPYTNACARVLLAVRKDDPKEFASALKNAILLADSVDGDEEDGGDSEEEPAADGM